MVGTSESAIALVTSDVLMYTTCKDEGVWEAVRRYELYSSDSAASAREQPMV